MDDHSPNACDEINATDDLELLYDKPRWTAFAGEIDHVNAQYRRFIESAPFVAVATNGPHGLECSARGGAPGFVRIRDEKTLLLPDRLGNNRLDTLHNIIHDARIALLFLIPGCREILRVKGRAVISRQPEVTRLFGESAKKPPATVLAISVESVHFQCAGALARARLWEKEKAPDRLGGKRLASPNAILAGITWQRLCRTLRLPRLKWVRAAFSSRKSS